MRERGISYGDVLPGQWDRYFLALTIDYADFQTLIVDHVDI